MGKYGEDSKLIYDLADQVRRLVLLAASLVYTCCLQCVPLAHACTLSISGCVALAAMRTHSVQLTPLLPIHPHPCCLSA